MMANITVVNYVKTTVSCIYIKKKVVIVQATVPPKLANKLNLTQTAGTN